MGIAMAGMESYLEIGLMLLLAATLFHAMRLERALGVLKRDRAALEQLVNGFNASSRAAEKSIADLREATEGAGRQIARQVESAIRLKDDLDYLTQRGNRMADQLERLLRETRTLERPPEPPRADPFAPVTPPLRAEEPQADAPRPRSRAEQELIRALRLAR
jgi:septal ring factor EnvC (AmiA/AmiB activator)